MNPSTTLSPSTIGSFLSFEVLILYYRNVIIHYGGYDADDQLQRLSNSILKGKNGNTALIRKRLPAYDLSNPKVRDWWVKSCSEMTSDPAIDGVFLDGDVKVLEPRYLAYDIGVEKKIEVIKGY